MQEKDGFYTLKGYQTNETAELTTAMEDYLEMICRLLQDRESVRVGDLSRAACKALVGYEDDSTPVSFGVSAAQKNTARSA